MIVTIIGIGRSGTTLLYRSLQTVMDRQYGPESVRCLYEPFLRDQGIFDGRLDDGRNRFELIDSLSVDGLFSHQRLPMLIDNPGPFLDDAFISSIYRNDRSSWTRRKPITTPTIVKFIRATGRYRLINKIAGRNPSIFIIRNPLDIANSLRGRFSFYGGEFHRDDKPRFEEEVRAYFDLNERDLPSESYIASQLFYWYYSNRFALESFKSCKNRPLIFVYEDMLNAPEHTIKRMCEHCGLDYHPSYARLFDSKAGPVTAKKSLHKEDMQVALKYLHAYQDLLAEHGLQSPADPKQLTETYREHKQRIEPPPGYGLHARSLMKQLADAKKSRSVEGGKPKPEDSLSSGQAASPVLFTHLVNPTDVPESSDLSTAQPITFESMKNARLFAKQNGIEVRQVAAVFEEDQHYAPENFERARNLHRSALDLKRFSHERKLPLFGDILDRLNDYQDSEYLIYTNVDIGLMPHFYTTLKEIMSTGLDAAMIHRRTLGKNYTSVDDLPTIYTDYGSDHPGTDCFVMRSELVEKFDLGNIVIGAQFCAFALRANIFSYAQAVKEHPKLHMTFHIGDDRVWESLDEFSAYNAEQIDEMFERLAVRNDLQNPDQLNNFKDQFRKRKAAWKKRRGIE